jgi:hypothetical protein
MDLGEAALLPSSPDERAIVDLEIKPEPHGHFIAPLQRVLGAGDGAGTAGRIVRVAADSEGLSRLAHSLRIDENVRGVSSCPPSRWGSRWRRGA